MRKPYGKSWRKRGNVGGGVRKSRVGGREEEDQYLKCMRKRVGKGEENDEAQRGIGEVKEMEQEEKDKQQEEK